MELIIGDNESAREAIKALAAEVGISITALADRQKISTGTLTRFVYKRTRRAGDKIIDSGENVHLLTFLRAVDGAGYEVVVRPRVTGSRRERRLQALKEQANGRGQGGVRRSQG